MFSSCLREWAVLGRFAAVRYAMRDLWLSANQPEEAVKEGEEGVVNSQLICLSLC